MLTIAAEFKIQYSQFLDKNGKPTQDLPHFANDSKHLVELYRWMVLTRTFDTKAIALQRTGKMGTYASSLGQEAITVAIGATMEKDDVLAPAYREYGAQFQRGVEMHDILAYWGGDERGSDFNNKDDLPISVPIASQLLHAAGIAKAIQLRKQNRVVVTVCGDGGTSEGDFYEAINVAGAWNLPIVFVVSNNQWAISVSRKIQTGAKTLAQKAIAAGIHGEQVDGNDIIAMKEAMTRALERARENNQPTLIEAITYRLSDHTTADDASRYREETEVKEAWEKEPLVRFKQYLLSINAWDENKEKKLELECKQKVEAGVEKYLTMPAPAPEAMFDFLYEELPEPLLEQYEMLLANK